MVRLKWLQIRGFRSFTEETRVTLPPRGLVLIRGRNPETGDSSGSGKSSLLLALAYVLDVLPKGFPATELQSWFGDQPLQVVLGLDVDGQEVVVGRGQKTFVRYGDGKPVTGARAFAEEHRKLFGLSPPVLGALTYRAQGTPGLFLSRTDSEKKEFLTQVLGLDAIEAAVETAEAKVKDFRVHLDVAEQQVQHAQQHLDAVRGAPPQAPIETADLQSAVRLREEEVLEKEGKLQVLRGELEQHRRDRRQGRNPKEAALQEQLKQAHQYLQKLREADNLRRGEHHRRVEELRQQLRHFDATLQNIRHLKERRGEVQRSLEASAAGNCPTCSRQWDASRQAEAGYRQRLAELDANIGGEGAIQVSRDSCQRQLEGLSFTADPSIEKLVGITEKLGAELQALQRVVDPPEVLRSIADAEARVYTSRLALKDAESELRVAAARREAQQREAQQYATRLAGAQQCLEDAKHAVCKLAADLGAERDFVGVLGREGFLGVIFEEVLREIAAEANDRLSRLANVGHVGVGFRTEAVTATKGTLRRSITTVVNVGGREARPETGLSGGMLTSVEQVVDLAVMAVVQRRTSRTPGWLCLDEVFNGQGPATKETAMEVLREFAADKLVLVVDHGSEFQELFSAFIDVEQRGGVSRVVS